jgi:vacuolar protein sorting-associated protein 13A/C
LANYHKETFKFNALRLLGASNLIGNPSRFVNNIGTGVSDFFVKPYQGIKDGGIVKMKDGFMDGSKSLIKNSLMAPVGAMAKIGQSISKGTLALSFDDKFIEEKNEKERRNQPKSMSDGMKKGFASAGSSIYSGISGVFTKPIEGAKTDGVFGFLKGGAQGAAGLVTKTISGGIDIIAKTSEGLDNQSKSLTQLKVAHRIRRPRSFYEVDNIIRPYNEFHSFWVTMVPQLNDQLDISKLYDVFQIHEDVKLIEDDKRDPHPDAEPTPDNCI